MLESATRIIGEFLDAGRTGVYARSFLDNKTGKLSYQPIVGRVTGDDIAHHLNGGPYLGVYFIEPARSTCRLGCLDLDDKSGDAYDQIRTYTIQLRDSLKRRGFDPLLERSGSGRGIHIWLHWKTDQEATRVRALLLKCLEECELTEGANGVKENQVEVFPKQTFVEPGKFGNLVALPFNRNSCILRWDNLEPFPTENLESVYLKISRDITAEDIEATAAPKVTKEKKPRAKKEVYKPLTIDEIKEALASIPNEDSDYDYWLKLLYAVHSETGGSNEGLQIFADWSAQSEKHDQKYTERTWALTKSRDTGGVTIGTLIQLARENGWFRFSGIADNYVYVEVHKVYIDKITFETFDLEAFKLKYLNLAADLGKQLLAEDQVQKATNLTYWPGAALIIVEDGIWKFNLWRDPRVEPIDGDVTPFLDHVEYIFPNDAERGHFLDFLAHMVQRPDVKIRHAVVLQGREGIGKSYFSFLLKLLLGSWNVRVVENQDIQSDYNDWMVNVQAVVVEEIAAFGKREFMNKLKAKITQDEINVQQKYQRAYSIKNRVNYIMFTNHEDALLIDEHDRRYFVVFSDAEPHPTSYYERLFQWTEGNYRAIKAWLLKRDLSHFHASAKPPTTKSKLKMISDNKSDIQMWIEDSVINRTGVFEKDIVTLQEISNSAPNSIANKASPQALRRLAPKVKIDSLGKFQIKFRDQSEFLELWTVRHKERWRSATPDEVIAEYMRNAVSKDAF